MEKRKFAIVAIGELLGDFIGAQPAESLYSTDSFLRFQGGSPANLASNLARLGFETAIVSSVGNDNLGKFLVEEVKATGVDTSYVKFDSHEPSSIVLVSRTTGTPDFIPYRTADKNLFPDDIPKSLLSQCSIFHTTCWPLSRQPSQATVLETAKKAKALGCVLSADLNYAEKVWPNRKEAYAVIKAYLSLGALIKLSEDDAERFYGEKVTHQQIFKDFHSWGADLICYTMGGKGSVVSTNNGQDLVFNEPQALEVVDATGAGDSFWSGFLAAFLDNQPPEICAKAGANMARIKLSIMGPIKEAVLLSSLYQ
jgi:sugar/nucleoside kinase (ribokinase family)